MKTLLLASLIVIAVAQPLAAGEQSPARRIVAGDVLGIEVMADSDAEILLQPVTVVGIGDDGLVSLGTEFDSVQVNDKTIAEAEEAILQSIQRVAEHKDHRVNVRIAHLGHDSADDPKLVREQGSYRRLSPRTVVVGDVLQIESFADGLNVRTSTVESDGNLALGARWGRVNIVGKTLVESEAIIHDHVAAHLKDSAIQVTFANEAGGSQLGGFDGRELMTKLRQFDHEISEFKTLIHGLRALRPR